MVANTSHPDILGFTQRYAGGNKKEESPYSGEYCLYSVPGMVAKLRPTEREKHSQKVEVKCTALSVTFDFFGESDWGSDWAKMDNVTLYYFIIILYNLGAKPNFLKWDDKEKMVKLDRLVMYGCQIGAQVHRAGGDGGHLSPMVLRLKVFMQ